MKQNVFLRLKEYYQQVSAALQGDAKAATIFPNSSDKGFSREAIYAEFLNQHCPSKCNIFYGGYIFGMDGSESSQLDILINSDTSPRYDFLKRGTGKSFCHIEGTIAAVSIKSTLDKKELFDALNGIASIPESFGKNTVILPPITLKKTTDWPLKVIYASDGISGQKTRDHITEFYNENPDIKTWQKPHIIHVAGKHYTMRATDGVGHWDAATNISSRPEIGDFNMYTHEPDLGALMWVIENIHWRASISDFILHDNGDLINKVLKAPNK